MFDYFRKRKERIEQEKEKHISNMKILEHDAKLRIESHQKDMMYRPCAIRNMELCSSNCVHFEGGYLGFHASRGKGFNYDLLPIAILSKCKLWK